MPMIWGNLATVTITLIYYAYRAYQQTTLRKRKVLRERVAYMLWVMAERTSSSAAA
jgi:hypothetical protein